LQDPDRFITFFLVAVAYGACVSHRFDTFSWLLLLISEISLFKCAHSDF
jgi:hypothetical protein